MGWADRSAVLLAGPELAGIGPCTLGLAGCGTGAAWSACRWHAFGEVGPDGTTRQRDASWRTLPASRADAGRILRVRCRCGVLHQFVMRVSTATHQRDAMPRKAGVALLRCQIYASADELSSAAKADGRRCKLMRVIAVSAGAASTSQGRAVKQLSSSCSVVDAPAARPCP